MQTFMPYADFEMTAHVLDYKRLGKQRIETKQLLNTLNGKSIGWKTHPACLMWKGHEYQLARYGEIICKEWIRRGYVDNQLSFFVDLQAEFLAQKKNTALPSWMGMEEFHASHRSNLLRKDPKFYKKFRWNEKNDMAYFWPVVF